ncbi:MAG: hypothetical protein U0V70_08545 [Terriglobia bacterium]
MILRIGAHVLGCLLLLMAVFNSPLFEQYGASSRYGMGIWETLPLRLLLGKETRESYLNRQLPNYPVVEFYNQLPRPKKVLFWWNTTASIYYADSQALWLYSPQVLRSFGRDPKKLHRNLVESGITHIITGQPGQSGHLIVQPEGEFVRHYLKKLFQKNATILYQVLPAPVDQEFVAYDFLSHIGEAQVKMPNRPEGRGLVLTSSIQDDQRYVLMTSPPAEVEYSLTLGQLPKLRFAIGQSIPHCSGRASFQVWIVSNGQREQIYERELFAEARQQDVGWFNEEVDLKSYSGQNVRIIFRTEYLEGESCTWYAWADPVIVCNPSSDPES